MQGLSAHRWSKATALEKYALYKGRPFLEISTHLPVSEQGDAQPQRLLDALAFLLRASRQPFESGAHVFIVLIEPVQPVYLFSADKQWRDTFYPRKIVGGMGGARTLQFSCLGQSFQTIFAQCLQ